MWFENSSIYQIYPFGFVGAPAENDGVLSHRILKVIERKSQQFVGKVYFKNNKCMIK